LQRNQVIRALLFVAVLIGVAPASAQEATNAKSAISGMVQLTVQPSRDRAAQRSIFGQLLYLQHELGPEGLSAFVQLYHDQSLSSGFLGAGRQIGDFQLAIAVGPARFGDRTHLTLNPWVYYVKGDIEGSLYAERYLGKTDAPWYFKGHAQKLFENGLIVGVYGETGVGVGPMIGYQIVKSTSLTFTVPVIARSGLAGVAILRFDF